MTITKSQTQIEAVLSDTDWQAFQFLAALGRRPRQKEIRVAQRLFSAATPRQAAEDFLWALLNSYDFLFVQ